MKTKYLTKTKAFEGLPKLSDFKIVEEDIEENLADGGKMLQAFHIEWYRP